MGRHRCVLDQDHDGPHISSSAWWAAGPGWKIGGVVKANGDLELTWGMYFRHGGRGTTYTRDQSRRFLVRHRIKSPDWDHSQPGHAGAVTNQRKG